MASRSMIVRALARASADIAAHNQTVQVDLKRRRRLGLLGGALGGLSGGLLGWYGLDLNPLLGSALFAGLVAVGSTHHALEDRSYEICETFPPVGCRELTMPVVDVLAFDELQGLGKDEEEVYQIVIGCAILDMPRIDIAASSFWKRNDTQVNPKEDM